MNLTAKQHAGLEKVARPVRTNLKDLHPRTGASLIRRGLIAKDWHQNDAAGERVRLTSAGIAVASRLLGA